MTDIREIFAKNLRENRRKSGLTQVKLAEKADISTHYIAMIELARNFPKADIIERLAKALDIEIYELFLVPHSSLLEVKELHGTIIKELKNIVKESVENAFEKRDTKYKID
ncbi:MAG: helix-turn-helix transcriptional regulator [Spirochaetaceae bacterium]|nr:helix-turn-helix transcriptional regulator [Spirochaetaceae bacterium]